jgi:hypothetical protein
MVGVSVIFRQRGLAIVARPENCPALRRPAWTLTLMSSSIATAPRKATPARTQSNAGRRRLLWAGSGLLVLVLAALLALAFSLGTDQPAAPVPASVSTTTVAPAHPADAALPTADSAEMVVDNLPGPPPRIINGMAVDAEGNSIDPNLTRPADDADTEKDDSADEKTSN